MTQSTTAQFQNKEVMKRYARIPFMDVPKDFPKGLIYLCTPTNGDLRQNYLDFFRWSSIAEDEGYIAVSPLLCVPQFVEQYDPSLLRLSQLLNKRLVESCDRFWLCGDITGKAMQAEIDHAVSKNIPIDNINKEVDI